MDAREMAGEARLEAIAARRQATEALMEARRARQEASAIRRLSEMESAPGMIDVSAKERVVRGREREKSTEMPGKQAEELVLAVSKQRRRRKVLRNPVQKKPAEVQMPRQEEKDIIARILFGKKIYR